jgi:hypothetical protein
MTNNYLRSALQQFEFYKMLGEKTMTQLSNEQLFWQYNEDSNSIAVMVKHLRGNMLSRWTDFLKSDGEKEWRERDAEFEGDLKSREDIINQWEEGWKCLFDALKTINESNFSTTVYIRNQGHTVVEAMNRQLTHYAYHVGQIVYVGKMLKGEEWESLSIPKNKSKDYNKDKIAQPKHKEHFTKEFLKG